MHKEDCIKVSSADFYTFCQQMKYEKTNGLWLLFNLVGDEFLEKNWENFVWIIRRVCWYTLPAPSQQLALFSWKTSQKDTFYKLHCSCCLFYDFFFTIAPPNIGKIRFWKSRWSVFIIDLDSYIIAFCLKRDFFVRWFKPSSDWCLLSKLVLCLLEKKNNES